MRVFIVGATGVLGRALVPRLLNRGHALRALVRSPERAAGLVASGVELRPGDLLEAEIEPLLPAMLAGSEAVVHAATAIPADPSAPHAWEATARLRTEGTRRLLDAALTAGAGRYLQQSIVMAYADGGDRWLTESWPLDTSPQRAAVCAPVAAMEGMVRATPVSRLAWSILRGGQFVGPETGQDIALRRLRQGTLRVPGDGHNYFSPIHVEDMAAAMLAALEQAPAGSVFNLTDEPMRYGDYADGLAATIAAASPLRDPAASTPPSWRCDSSAARRLLGWTPSRGVWPSDEQRRGVG